MGPYAKLADALLVGGCCLLAEPGDFKAVAVVAHVACHGYEEGQLVLALYGHFAKT